MIAVLGQQLAVYTKRGLEWELLVNINSELSDYLRENPPSLNNTDQQQKSQVYCRHIAKFTWTSPLRNSQTALSASYLIVANLYNNLYGILPSANRVSSKTQSSARELDIDCGSQTVSSLCWIGDRDGETGLLAVGFANGGCRLVTLDSDLKVRSSLNLLLKEDSRSVENLQQIAVSEYFLISF